ncbi:MAG: M1 family metallopeptidase [Ignavibacteriae bacterium]|nr:M1 family metallopeptidase [Ignavibacteriota bacterium]
MKKSLIASIEYAVWIIACVGLAAFIGLPSSDPLPNEQVPTQSVPSFTQSGETWGADLVLPQQSDRIASYTMDIKLAPAERLITGTEILEWKNTTGQPQQTFPFHLYHNAWKNNRSTYVKENNYQFEGRRMGPEDYGYTNVKRVALLEGDEEIDITATFKYIQPDDGNEADQTVFQITTPRAVPNGQSMRLKIEFETKQPIPMSRTGAIRNYHFVAQWFPKIGVWSNPQGDGGAWNCHQFHANTEFFADYGVYDVSITLPSEYVIGATGGIPTQVRDNGDGTTTHRFYQEDVHDFAWVTAPDLVCNERVFSHTEPEADEQPGRHHPLREVKVILLTQPHHGSLIERYFDATFKALRYYGEWYGKYPYETVTVVDPANDSRSGGMEYPTLFTGGGNLFAPDETPIPESVTVHEFGHQFWYGLIGNNEFEEAWLDEGFNSYSQERTLYAGWKPFKAYRYFFGGPGAGTGVGIPYVFEDINVSRYTTGNSQVREQGKQDVMARKGWEYNDSYGFNSYTKPAMSLWTLERYLGEETMYRVMRTYHHRFRFRHPTTQDFISTVNEVSDKDMNWFFENTWFSDDVFDYSISEVTNRAIPKPQGVFSMNGETVDPPADTGKTMYECAVVVQRLGEAIAPVDVKIVFEDGETWTEQWDGKDRWKKFVYRTTIPVKYAIVDPDGKLTLDINYNNNGRVVRGAGYSSLAARKIASKWMFWAQNYFEFNSFWH